MDRRDLLANAGVLALLSLAGCTRSDSPAVTDTEPDTDRPPTDGGTSSPTDDPTEDPPEGEPAVDDERLAELVAGNAGFALDLHDRLVAEDGGNLFTSPYSVSVALAMTYAGARAGTERKMRETLRYTLGQDVHPAFADLRAELESRATTRDPVEDEEADAFQLNVANGVWAEREYPVADDYEETLDAHYAAGLQRADFAGAPDAERERINGWVADETEGRIENLLPEGAITPQTVMVLANAIYFVASWQFEFDPAETEEATFTAADGSESTVPMMQQNLRTNYAAWNGHRAIELPYVGDEVSMVLLLPAQGEFESFERNLDAGQLFGIFDELGDASGDLRLPRFEYRTEAALSEPLAELGMSDAFGSGANFSGMVEEGDGPWIDEVYHSTFVSVDEEGTEAAASTAVVMEESAPQTSFDLTFDRPFLFCIRDRPTDAVLFLGRVVDAGAAQG